MRESDRNIGGRYAIVGLGMRMQPLNGKSPRVAEAEAVQDAIDDAGLKRSDIDGALELRRSGGGGDQPFWDDPYPRIMGLPIRFFFNVGQGGALATLGIATAIGFLESGMADYVVLAGVVDDWSRSRETRKQGHRGKVQVERAGYWGKAFGDLRAPCHHSWMAARHMHEYGTRPEQFGAIAVQQRGWAQFNPDAKMFGKPMTLDDYLASPTIVDPYRLFDICQISDGAIAVILTSAERAHALKKTPVYVAGLGSGHLLEHLWWDQQQYTHMAVETAKKKAFAMAGANLTDLDFAQLYDCFTGEVLLQLEDYGWCEKGEGGAYVEDGHIGPGGDNPVNTSGGLLSAYHMGDLTGLSEAVLQLRGEAGARQVQDAHLGLVTGHGGELVSPGMCSIHTTLLLGNAS